MSEKNRQDIRIILTDEILDEYLELKKSIGTLSDTETIRVIIHTLFKRVKSNPELIDTLNE